MTWLPARKALRPEFSYPEAVLVWVLRASLVGLGAFALATGAKGQATLPVLAVAVGVGLGASLLFAFVETDRPRTLSAAEAAFLAMVSLHVAGHGLGLYERVAWYDRALHFALPLVTGLVFFALSQATDWVWDWRKVTPVEVGVYLFSMTLAVGALWEIVEFGTDTFLGTREQEGLVDTMLDLVADAAGAVVGAVAGGVLTSLGRKHGLHAVSEEPSEHPRGDGVPGGSR